VGGVLAARAVGGGAPGGAGRGVAAHVLAPFCGEAGRAGPTPPERVLPAPGAQRAAALEAKPAALSLVFGVPPAWVRDRAREQGTAIIGTATTVAEAEALEAGEWMPSSPPASRRRATAPRSSPSPRPGSWARSPSCRRSSTRWTSPSSLRAGLLIGAGCGRPSRSGRAPFRSARHSSRPASPRRAPRTATRSAGRARREPYSPAR